MKKGIFIAAAVLTGSVVFAQKRLKEPPLPPAPPVVHAQEALAPPPLPTAPPPPEMQPLKNQQGELPAPVPPPPPPKAPKIKNS